MQRCQGLNYFSPFNKKKLLASQLSNYNRYKLLAKKKITRVMFDISYCTIYNKYKELTAFPNHFEDYLG